MFKPSQKPKKTKTENSEYSAGRAYKDRRKSHEPHSYEGAKQKYREELSEAGVDWQSFEEIVGHENIKRTLHLVARKKGWVEGGTNDGFNALELAGVSLSKLRNSPTFRL